MATTTEIVSKLNCFEMSYIQWKCIEAPSSTVCCKGFTSGHITDTSCVPLETVTAHWQTFHRAEPWPTWKSTERSQGQGLRENPTSPANCATFTGARRTVGSLLCPFWLMCWELYSVTEELTRVAPYRLVAGPRQGAAPVVFGERGWGHFQFHPAMHDCCFSGVQVKYCLLYHRIE